MARELYILFAGTNRIGLHCGSILDKIGLKFFHRTVTPAVLLGIGGGVAVDGVFIRAGSALLAAGKPKA